MKALACIFREIVETGFPGALGMSTASEENHSRPFSLNGFALPCLNPKLSRHKTQDRAQRRDSMKAVMNVLPADCLQAQNVLEASTEAHLSTI